MATMDSCVERDGPCRGMRPKYLWSYPSDIAKYLEEDSANSQRSILLVDVRSFALYCGKHIQSAVNLSFSPILMRRLLKGVLTLDSLITDSQILSSIEKADQVVLYDTNSTPSNTKPELLKLIDMLQSRFDGKLNLKVLLGGMETFQLTFAHLCTTEQPGQVTSPTIVTLDTSSIATSTFGTPEATPVEILPFLYLGSAKDSSDLRILQKMNITAVLNITTSCPNHFESYLEYKSIPVDDTEQADLLSRLQTAITFIDDVKSKGGSVFVHCHAGISRSATVCIAYLMEKKQMTVEDAYKFVQSKRPIISPNLGFMGQLMVHQQNLQALWSSSSPLQHNTTSTTDSLINSLSSSSSNTVLTNSCTYTPELTSLPEEQTTPTRSLPTTTRRKSRDGLKLTLTNDSRRKSIPSAAATRQISPCRIEATTDRLTLSLTLPPTTCT